MSEAERAGTSRQDKSERLLAGRYRLGEVLGRGGMGTVWRAKDETLGRTVAVKELRFPSSIDEDEKRRLITRTLREAKAIARIRNNAAVTVFDVVDEDDRPWIVMELVEGKSLAEVIRQDGTLTPKRAAEVGLAVLDVLRSAHREGILHRDVKPSNVLIAEDGRVVLTDFGIAQVEGDPSITSTGMLVGAPSYISPERARGHKPGPAADLWSLGGLLYASVEGVPPYDKGSAIATLTAVMTEPVDPPKNAGPLQDVIYGLLVKDPEQRLDDAGARAMLLDVLRAPEKPEPEPVEATKVVPLPGLPPAARGKRPGPAGGAKKGEEAAERLRGALRSVRKAAGAGTAAAAASGTRAEAASPDAGPAASAAKGADARTPVPSQAPSAASRGSAARTGGRTPAARTAAAGTGATASSWNAKGETPPPRSTPRAPLTDVVPKRTLVIVAVVVVLAVIGTILALTLGGDDTTSSTGGGSGATASSGANAGNDTRTDETDGTRTDGGASASGDASPSGSPSATEGAGGGSGENEDEPDEDEVGGVNTTTYKSSQGFSIGLPEGWKYQSTSRAGSRFTGPDGQKLLIGWTSQPKSDPVADWQNQEKYMVRSQYQRISIKKVDYRDWNTADWEFTYVDGGTKYRTIDRGTVVNGSLGYGIMYTAKASEWDSDLRRDTWSALTKTFKPKS
ncbi:serine/threonine protein kinase [Streptomyces minutiscleroticus]|uniref:non-specific serine/threonine protein kinase n=1 Tax=Streptomyces minutiscleroticus TaxID=68238 RepID=A0A918NF12_9ACTN|nr:serine/threonine-protein kinase [Streptomyces minutiscleroticus]GGX68002.1 serine/threonine protein kinase [Streptomyces minutiscleroticus]